jgi:subtilisin family serine protease
LSLAVAVVAAGVVVPAVAAVPGAVAAPGAAAPTVTLLTGDEVTVGAAGVRVRAAQGREHVAFHTRTDEQGDTHVVPADVLPLLSGGKLDHRLFDVSELARIGYDDASRDRLPLIVDYPGRTPRMAGARVSRELPGMSAVSVERSAAAWPALQNAEHVWLDGPVHASLDHSVPQIGAPEAWAGGHTGAGTTVAVLDTGIDATHPDLADAVAGAENFSASDTVDDRAGHGTHVASTITGNGAKYQGVAPDTRLLNGKVLDDNGDGFESGIIAGMEWAVASGADVVNMSLGTRFPSDGTDPMSQAVNRLTAETGALFVIAAGNSGGPVGSPGAADAALTVGAVDRDDRLADFSSRGHLSGALKPDITAPGVDIVAAKAKNGWLGTPVGDGYVAMSGTSMATPHVAGAAAILAGQHPDWQAGQLKAVLMGSAKPNGSVFEQGAGRVDVARASTATVFASPGNLDFGKTLWPHDDDEPIAKTVTYTNTGGEPVTLDLSADVTGVPQGMFTFTPDRLTVPAGGQATATVTADTSMEAENRSYGGVITATGGGQSVRTVVGVYREAEAYDVTLTFLDHGGSPTELYFAVLTNVDNREDHVLYGTPSTVTLRLPRGEYFFTGSVFRDAGGPENGSANFVEPALEVTRDIDLVLDPREAEPVGFQLDKPGARPTKTEILFTRQLAGGETSVGVILPGVGLGTVKPATTSSDAFTFTTDAHLAEWNGESFDGSPYIYHVRHTEKGTVPRTLQWRYRDKQFAKVRSEHAATGVGTVGQRDDFLTIPLPSTLTEYYTPDVPWTGSVFYEMSAPDTYPVLAAVYQSAPRTFRLGRTTTVRWGFGVFGPAVPVFSHADRYGDRLAINVPMAVDQDRDRQGYEFTGTSTLLRDGAVVGENPYAGGGGFEVGPERAEYTLRTTLNRRTELRLSTEISAEWTFTSEHADVAALPFLVVRFAPNLDGHNAAPAGKRFSIPVYVQRNGAELGQVNTPVVEVSYDDGVTWQAAKVKRDRGEWKAVVDHPAGAEFVSLRSSVSDAAGNTQRQTITRAYALV